MRSISDDYEFIICSMSRRTATGQCQRSEIAPAFGALPPLGIAAPGNSPRRHVLPVADAEQHAALRPVDIFVQLRRAGARRSSPERAPFRAQACASGRLPRRKNRSRSRRDGSDRGSSGRPPSRRPRNRPRPSCRASSRRAGLHRIRFPRRDRTPASEGVPSLVEKARRPAAVADQATSRKLETGAMDFLPNEWRATSGRSATST